MMTFPLLDETSAPKGALEALAKTKKNFGMIPNVEKVMRLRFRNRALMGS